MGKRTRRRGIKPEELKSIDSISVSHVFKSVAEKSSYPRIAVGAPVAERAWILPQWFECLKHQTIRPRFYCFNHTPGADNTKQLIQDLTPSDATLRLMTSKYGYFSREERGSDTDDPWRAQHMSNLRNELRGMFLRTDADYFFSLDTDILLEQDDIIERLVQHLVDHEVDLIQPTVYLHPWEDKSDCYNAGFLGPTAGPEDPDQIWVRADKNHFTCAKPGKPFIIDTPMAAVLMRRSVLGMCGYRPHSQGEDIGFAQQLKLHKFKAGWRTDIVARHVWHPSYMQKVSA